MKLGTTLFAIGVLAGLAIYMVLWTPATRTLVSYPTLPRQVLESLLTTKHPNLKNRVGLEDNQPAPTGLAGDQPNHTELGTVEPGVITSQPTDEAQKSNTTSDHPVQQPGQHLQPTNQTGLPAVHQDHGPMVETFPEPYPDPDPSNCTARTSIYYLKIHKTASSTMTTTLDRYVLYNNLTQLPIRADVYPGNNIRNAIVLVPNHTLPSQFHVFGEHAVFNEAIASTLIGPNPAYIASVRFPLTHIRSVFTEYKIAKKLEITDPDPVATFLQDLAKYGESPSKIYTKSLQARMFGISDRNLGNLTYVSEYIKYIESRFSLVMVSEYFDESMVLLRRKLCWSMRDIVYLVQRVSKAKAKHPPDPPRPSLEHIHRNYSTADYIIYDHFSHRLFQQILKQVDFMQELNRFRTILTSVSNFCEPFLARLKNDPGTIRTIIKENSSISYDPYPWGQVFHINGLDCALMKLDTVVFRNILKVKFFPELCSSPNITRTYRKSSVYFNVAWRKDKTLDIHQAYCSSLRTEHKIPLEVLAQRSAYMW